MFNQNLDSQADHLQPRIETVSLGIFQPQLVSIALDRIQDAIESCQVPNARQLAAKNSNRGNIILTIFKGLSGSLCLITHPFLEWSVIQIIDGYAILADRFNGNIDDPIGDILNHIPEHMSDMCPGDSHAPFWVFYIWKTIANKIL
jgi:hypothetical protein